MSTYPFVIQDRKLEKDIVNAPVLIFGNDQNTCCIESIIFTNTTEYDCKITLYCLPDSGELLTNMLFTAQSLADSQGSYIIKQNIIVPPYAIIDVLQGMFLNLKPGDILFAFSQDSFTPFNSWINYSELKQLPLGANND